MREFNFRNLEKDIICEDFNIKDGRTTGLCINDNYYNLINIPSVEIANLNFFILQKNMCDYLIIINKNEGIEYSIKIQQDIINSKAKIVNIYFHMYISSENSLCNFVDFSKQSLTNFYCNYMPYLLTFLPYTSEEVDWYRNEISFLLSNVNKNVETKIKLKKERKPLKEYTVDGKTYPSLSALCRAYNIANDTVRMRLKAGMPLEEALTKPIQNTGKRLLKLRKEDNNE